MSKKNKIKNKLLEIINEDGTEWKVIVEEIKKNSHYKKLVVS